MNFSFPTACQTTLCHVHVVPVNITFFKRFFYNVCCWFVKKLETNEHKIIVNLKESDIGTVNLLGQVRE